MLAPDWLGLSVPTYTTLVMKRTLSQDYFSSDGESDALLVDALEQFERHEDADQVASTGTYGQTGGAAPLFAFNFEAVGQRRRWRNVVRGQSFRATLHQLRDARPSDNIGEALTEALRAAINSELERLEVRPHDRVNFSMEAHGFAVAFQSVNFEVREFLERSLRLDTLLQSLANKLNSTESFDPQQGFEVLLSVIAMPTPGSRPLKSKVGRRCMEKVLKTKQCLIPIKNKDLLCCARAIVAMRAHCHKDRDGVTRALWSTLRQGRPRQTTAAQELHRLAGVPEGPCGIEELQQFQDVLGNEYQLVVLSFCKLFMLIFKGPEAPHIIRLVKADIHYHGCTSFPAFVNKSYYCLECEKGYDHEESKHHSCKGRVCKSCNRKTCPDYRIGTMPATRCPACNSLFFGEDCLQFHRSGKECGKYRTCLICHAEYVYHPKKRHRCGFAKCPSCEEVVSVATHRCFIQPVDTHPPAEGKREKDPWQNALFVYADIEAMQLVDRSFKANMLCYRTSEEEEIHCLRGSTYVLEFLHDLDDLTDQPVEGEDDDDEDERSIIIIFHNLKGFDGNFILRELYLQQRSVTAQLTVAAKVLSFTSGPLWFKDSLCFLPMSLASFSGTFGITELKKGYFPHPFNTPENQAYVGRIPDVEFYDPEGMKDVKAKETFERWHADQVSRGVAFDFQKEMAEYCKSDVALLQAGCEAFCTQFSEIAGFNPMGPCVTIASACNLYWRREHLAPDCIAVEPMQGWRGARVNQSKAAFQWLYFCESQIPKEGASPDRIRHARNGGE